jgi:glycosyltransferase involved in cell wall biosynthesis
MLSDRPVTLLVEPDPVGHRFQAVAHVTAIARQDTEVVLLTSAGATASEEFKVYLADAELSAAEVFDQSYPPTREMLRQIVAVCRSRRVETVVVMDADQTLKRWWYLAPKALRGLPHRPRSVFFLTRYPAKLRLHDRVGWKLRVSKATLALAAKASRSLQHVAGFAGRDDMTPGWVVKRARDPAVCTAHSRDRAALRAELGLPADRPLVGVFGVLSERRNVPLIWDAVKASGLRADLVLGGAVQPEVAAWLAALPTDERDRMTVFDGFLDNALLDKLVAAVDVAPIALTNNGPSGIMGKALAADVPVVTAGSEVRARELRATGGGETADLTAEGIAAALRRVLSDDPHAPRASTVPPATAEEFAQVLLGQRRRSHSDDGGFGSAATGT